MKNVSFLYSVNPLRIKYEPSHKEKAETVFLGNVWVRL